VAVAMANLDRLPDTLENHAVREDIKAYLTAAMGQTVELAQRARAATSTSIASSRSRRSRASEHPSCQHRDDQNPPNPP
jgi:siroheme synthase (precorrin-2 oxidase/ferrochelatase)